MVRRWSVAGSRQVNDPSGIRKIVTKLTPTGRPDRGSDLTTCPRARLQACCPAVGLTDPN
jgi:hypothetical protein